MPKVLEDKLKAEYPNNPHAVYGTLNKIGMMHGNQETAKGRAFDAKHAKGLKAAHASHPNASRLGKYLHPKKGK